MSGMIEPVPRQEIERLFPSLCKGLTGERPFWDGHPIQEKEARLMHYVVYGPLSTKQMGDALRMFKSVTIVTREK